MKNKTPLTMIEQMVMILVFALAAALCLQVFILSDRISRTNAARDRAVLEAQNIAEILKSGSDGYSVFSSLNDADIPSTISYDADWNRTSENAAYLLSVRSIKSSTPLLNRAEITVVDSEGTLLFHLPVAWQKEVAGE